MGALPAVGIIHRRELAVSADPVAARAELAGRYADSHLRPEVAAAGGFIDELIEPVQTRPRVAAALRSLRSA
jgi:propionyl-CoA carboxylase beta chain